MPDEMSDDREALAELIGGLRAHLEWAAATGVREWPFSEASASPPAVARQPAPPPPRAPAPPPPPRAPAPPPPPPAANRQAEPSPRAPEQPRTPAQRRPTAPLRPDGQGPDSLALIAADIGHACTRCARSTAREPILHGTGRAGARLLIVGLEPAATDAVASEPFTGVPGRLLTRMLRAIGLGREDAFLTHLVKCRTIPARAPSPDELAACGGFLARQLRVVSPRAVLALGPEAGAAALGRHDPRGMQGLRAATGTFHGVPLIISWHPAQLLAEPRLKAEAWQDLRRLRAVVGEP